MQIMCVERVALVVAAGVVIQAAEIEMLHIFKVAMKAGLLMGQFVARRKVCLASDACMSPLQKRTRCLDSLAGGAFRLALLNCQ